MPDTNYKKRRVLTTVKAHRRHVFKKLPVKQAVRRRKHQ
jgi:ATP/maltotriose-dependent transcriptional regulator MalT